LLNTKLHYRFWVGISIILILYAVIKNFMIDPHMEGFLQHKTGFKQEFNLTVWLNVMYIHIAFACIAMAAGLYNFM